MASLVNTHGTCVTSLVNTHGIELGFRHCLDHTWHDSSTYDMIHSNVTWPFRMWRDLFGFWGSASANYKKRPMHHIILHHINQYIHQCVCVCVCVTIYMNIFTNMFVCVCLCTCVHTHAHTRAHTHMHTHAQRKETSRVTSCTFSLSLSHTLTHTRTHAHTPHTHTHTAEKNIEGNIMRIKASALWFSDKDLQSTARGAAPKAPIVRLERESVFCTQIC